METVYDFIFGAVIPDQVQVENAVQVVKVPARELVSKSVQAAIESDRRFNDGLAKNSRRNKRGGSPRIG